MEARPQREANIAPANTKISAMRPLLKIFSELRLHVKLIAVNQAICLFTLAIGFTIPFSLKWLTEQVQLGQYSVLVWLPLIGFVLLVLFAVMQMLRSIVSQYISIKISQSLQERILRHYLDHDIIKYSTQPMGEKVSRLTFDIHWFVEGAAIFLSETLYLPLVVTGCISIMLYLDWRIALVAIAVSPLSLVANKPFAKKLRDSSIDLQHHNALLSRHILDTLKGMLLIKVFAKENQESRQFENLLNKFVKLQVKNNFWGGLFRTTISVGNAFVVCLICWVAFYLLTGPKSLEVSTFVAFASVMFYFFGEIAKIGGIMNTLVKAAVSCDRIFSLLEEDRYIAPTGKEPALFRDNLIIKDATFRYGDGNAVLQDVNLTITRGETIAFMGMSGAGKTTLIHLMLGLLKPEKGRIAMDGKQLGDYESDSWRSLFGYSPQLNVLFFMSVADNIAYSNTSASREEIINVAKIACAHDFIMELPEGYDTIIGDEGANLSEGQRQRIALARAIIRDAPIIILDETSAHVDLITEQKIYQNIMSLPDKTVVLVSHRPSVLKKAATIYSIANGRVINVGSFGDLEEEVGHGELLRAMEFVH